MHDESRRYEELEDEANGLVFEKSGGFWWIIDASIPIDFIKGVKAYMMSIADEHIDPETYFCSELELAEATAEKFHIYAPGMVIPQDVHNWALEVVEYLYA